ncbi:pilus assembly protein [Tianweitania sediminis]|uniref:TadE/TadG family protein n=1 Tax=Tianweitania sediminis TaxID=1502156 RepID=A0A8J7RNV9_9HYPH|nr:pilus assembly protein [Tianweitania sediminis]MBP0439269.1 TadE/TadG family protein [Tianweitania sediminis]
MLLSFRSDRGGNFAILSAVLVVPLAISAGVMIDLSTISRTKTELQNALDAAALAVAREGVNLSDARAREIADGFVRTNFDPAVTQLNLIRAGNSVTVSGNTKAHMAFGGLLGYENWNVSVSSQADIAYAKYEIALVLDTTGSMAGGKLIAMKDAVLGLIDTMSAQVTNPDDLKFSLVPFSSFVNVGSQFGPKFDNDGQQIPGTGAPWLDLAGLVPLPQMELEAGVSRFQLAYNTSQPWSGCVETRVSADDFDVSDELPVKGKVNSLVVPAFAIDEPATGGYDNNYIASEVQPTDKTTRARAQKLFKYGVPEEEIEDLLGIGDVTAVLGSSGDEDDGNEDEDEGEDEDDENPKQRSKIKHSKVKIDDGISLNTRYKKGPNFGCVTEPISPLSNSYVSLKNSVRDLQARGNTNILEGVVWGMRALSPGEPFTEGASLEEEVGLQKIMIVLTDGANTLGNRGHALGSIYSSFGYLADGRLGISSGGDTATNTAMNSKTSKACENAKKTGITVFTIRLEEPDVKTGSLLQDCATSPGHYFDAPSRAQLDGIFQSIQDKIVRVRISS